MDTILKLHRLDSVVQSNIKYNNSQKVYYRAEVYLDGGLKGLSKSVDPGAPDIEAKLDLKDTFNLFFDQEYKLILTPMIKKENFDHMRVFMIASLSNYKLKNINYLKSM